MKRSTNKKEDEEQPANQKRGTAQPVTKARESRPITNEAWNNQPISGRGSVPGHNTEARSEATTRRDKEQNSECNLCFPTSFQSSFSYTGIHIFTSFLLFLLLAFLYSGFFSHIPLLSLVFLYFSHFPIGKILSRSKIADKTAEVTKDTG